MVTLLGRVAPPPREEHRLSAREVEILKLLSDGHSYKTAAHELAISIDTVRFHIRNIYEKLHVHPSRRRCSARSGRGSFAEGWAKGEGWGPRMNVRLRWIPPARETLAGR